MTNSALQPILECRDGTRLRLHVTPRASRSEWAGERPGALRIRLQAPPVDGKANEALLRFLAKSLDVPRRCITIEAGHSGRHKTVLLQGVDAERVRSLLTPTRTDDSHSTR